MTLSLENLNCEESDDTIISNYEDTIITDKSSVKRVYEIKIY